MCIGPVLQTHKYINVVQLLSNLTPYADRPSRRIRALVRSKALAAAASVAATVPAPPRSAATDAGRTIEVATVRVAAAAAAAAQAAAADAPPTAPTLAERAAAPADRAAWETIGCDAREIGTILLAKKREVLQKFYLPNE